MVMFGCSRTYFLEFEFNPRPTLSNCGKVLWVIVVSASFVAAVVLLLLSQNSFDENPTTLVTDTIHHPIWNYPFPAVTLCSFNKISRQRALEQADMLSYPAKAPNKPRHVSACGFQTSFEAIVNIHYDDYFAAESWAYGIKVFVHSSYDYPDWSLQSYLVGMKLMALVGINPTKTYALSEVRAINAIERRCYFKDEFPLQNFKFYSYQNCLTQCRMNIILKNCGCIPVVYVNEYDRSQASPVCSLSDLECLQRNKPLVKSSMPGVDLTLENSTKPYVWDTQEYPCDCLPDCEFDDYIFEASQGELSRKFSNNNQRNLYGGLQLINHSVIRIYFNDLIGTRNRRNVSHSWQTYLAFYGGILGLFVGFSFISVIEFIYFFAFKLLTDALKRLKPDQNLKKESVKVAEAFENPMKSTGRLRHREFRGDEAPIWFVH